MIVKSVGESKPSVADGDDDFELQKRIVLFLHRWCTADCELKVEVVRGVVNLSGKVASEHDRWLIVGCCRHVAGVLRVEDDLIIGATDTPTQNVVDVVPTAIIQGATINRVLSTKPFTCQGSKS